MSSHVVPDHPLGAHPVRYLRTPVPSLSRRPAPRPPSGLQVPAGAYLRHANPVVHPRHGMAGWMKLHRLFTIAIVGALMLAAATVAVLSLRIDTAVSPAAKASPVVFAAGDDYSAINSAGFATLTLGTSATSATLAVSGVPGAAQVSLGKVMKITNADLAKAYTVTLSRSTTLNAAITSLVVTVDGASTLVTWDAKSAASSSSFTLPANTVTHVTLAIVIADGTAVGALGSFTMQVALAPV